jgi:thiol:disulfide interchange protein
LSGTIRYSVCDKSTCKPPKKIPIALGIVAGAASTPAASLPGTQTPVNDVPADPQSIEIARFDLVEAAQSESLLVNLLFAFLGGLILNVMPCVLPVIAIKVISFVQQAGESRSRIMALNVAYTAGVVLVFLTLATLAVVLNQGWGGLFQNPKFNLAMAAFVFAMGLSLLGVFEISLPGIAGGGAHREGLPGAFFTGIFATLLATPCTGPFMGTTLAWSVKQSPPIVFLIWGVMGLGMASPYLVIGAFPRLVNWLPRPGMWMVRFKEFAGFVLMGAVIWLISSLHADLLIPALVILVGIALGLWMIGNLYDTASPIKHKWTVRTLAVVLSAIVIGFGWNMQYRSAHVAWEPFSTARIEQLRKEGKPILIDFTADWCLICKTNEAVALDRPETAEYLRRNGITAIKADFTDESPEISRWLDLARQEGVPLTLIFPKGQPNRAIPLRAAFTQSQLLEALKSATDGATEMAGDPPPASVAAPADSTMKR